MSTIDIAIERIEDNEIIYKPRGLTEVSDDNLRFSTSTKYRLNGNKESFAVLVTVEFFHLIEKKDKYKLIFKYVSKIVFKLKGLEAAFKVENEEDLFDIPDELINLLAGSAIGATRGLLVSKMADTILSGYYLPLIKKTEEHEDNKQNEDNIDKEE